MDTNTIIIGELQPTVKLSRDMLKAIRQGGPGGVTDNEARFLVDLYYTMQKSRIRLNNQVKGLDRDAKKTGNEAEPHDFLSWTQGQFDTLEAQVQKVLAIYTEQHPMNWFFAQTLGIGPVLSAGLLAHIDISRCVTCGHIWRFAGLDPTMTWTKGEKRPWNGALKTLCWKIGDSFVKLSGRQDAYYGQLYRKRKALEWERNLSGTNREAAAASLAKKRFGQDTDAAAWLTGQCDPAKARALIADGKPATAAACKAAAVADGMPMLPPAHIDMRARRYCVKLFLSHLHECWYREHHGTEPAKPFAIAIQGHAHYLPPPQKRPVEAAA